MIRSESQLRELFPATAFGGSMVTEILRSRVRCAILVEWGWDLALLDLNRLNGMVDERMPPPKPTPLNDAWFVN